MPSTLMKNATCEIYSFVAYTLELYEVGRCWKKVAYEDVCRLIDSLFLSSKDDILYLKTNIVAETEDSYIVDISIINESDYSDIVSIGSEPDLLSAISNGYLIDKEELYVRLSYYRWRTIPLFPEEY